ncbi:MAG TPA: hypothetical protein VGN42_14865, partial [Pirellulales bacterium]|nr:hypothetical protein [Pirellulales bacterium]
TLSTVSPALRWTLSITRILILLLLILVLAAPYLKLDLKIEKRPLLALLFDQSQSMGLPVGALGDEQLLKAALATGLPAPEGKVSPETKAALTQMSRAKLAHQAVAHQSGEWLKPLAEKYELRYYALGEDFKRLPLEAGKLEPQESAPQSAETRIGDGLAKLLDEAAGRQIAGIVLFSDGENTAGRAPVEAARAAADVGAPIFAVLTGSEAPLRDVAVVDLFAPDLVSVNDTVQVTATLEVQGYPEQAVKVMLFENEGRGGKAPATLLDSKDVVLRNTEQQHVELSFKAQQAGARTLTVRVQPTAELPEDLADNNSDSVAVRVSDDKLRVLYIEGLPRWDFRFLKNAMRRDHGLGGWGVRGRVVAGTAAGGAAAAPNDGKPGPAAKIDKGTDEPDLVLETEVRRLPAAERNVLPATLDALARYHTVILGDVSPALADSGFVELLAEAVRERGVGLIVAAGPQSMPHRYSERLQDLLPVKLKSRAAGIEAQAFKPFRLEISSEGAIHEAMRLYDDIGRNQEVWDEMPPFYWCAAAERPSPAATVLAYNPSVEGRFGKLPLVAHQYAGQGKVLFLGTDSTWLWRQNAGDRLFYKFWGQAIRFVARRQADDMKKKSWLEVRPVRARPGEIAEIELMAFDADGSPRQEAVLPLRVEQGDADSSSVEMLADKAVPGRYLGKFTPPSIGDYRFFYEPGGTLEAVEARMHVSPATEELRRPNVNATALAQLGKLVAIDQLGSIGGELAGEPKVVPLYSEASIWDNWLMLSLLILIYSVDVGLRRLAGLS